MTSSDGPRARPGFDGAGPTDLIYAGPRPVSDRRLDLLAVGLVGTGVDQGPLQDGQGLARVMGGVERLGPLDADDGKREDLATASAQRDW